LVAGPTQQEIPDWVATLRQLEARFAQHPFKMADPGQFRDARAMFKANPKRPGWALEMAEALGFMETLSGKIGGCVGCYFAAPVIPWIVEGIARESRNAKVLYLPRQYVSISMHKRGGPPPSIDSSAERNLAQIIAEFRRRPQLETVVVNGSLPDHATMLSISRKGNTFRIFWNDPNGLMKTNKIASELIKASLDGGGHEGLVFEIEYSSCEDGPQSMEELPPNSKEPVGYCRAWSALMLIFSVATDGAHPDQITRELNGMFGGNPAHMTNFIRKVTINVARLAREQAKPLDIECVRFLQCCDEETYCVPLDTR
jgi:hypothetical protein